MTIPFESTVQWHDGQLTADVDGKIIALSMSQGKYVGFDDIASAVWRRLEHPVTVHELVKGLARDFRGEAETMSSDVGEMLSQLAELQLIHVSTPR